MRNGLSKVHIICIVLLWLGFCAMLFVVPTSASLGENIFVAILSGLMVAYAVSKAPPRRKRED